MFVGKISLQLSQRNMGLLDWFRKKKSSTEDELFGDLSGCPYVSKSLHNPLSSNIHGLTAMCDLNTVFVCGGYAAFLAGFTSSFGDMDLFCTSAQTFNKICNRLGAPNKVAPNIMEGLYLTQKVNVIYNPDAISMEDFLDGFDFNWCQVGIDLFENTVVHHPLANERNPIFNLKCLAEPIDYAKNDLRAQTKRVFNRYLKYKGRRIIACTHDDDAVEAQIKAKIKTLAPIIAATDSSKIVRTRY